MKIRHDQTFYLYDRIRKEVRDYQKRVLILVSPSVDSTCSAKIQTSFFQIDKVQYSIVPVTNNADLYLESTRFLKTHDNNVTQIFLGCGGSVNLHRMLKLDQVERDNVVVVVFDSHRPLHHYNQWDENSPVRVQLDESDMVDNVPGGDVIDKYTTEEQEEDDFFYMGFENMNKNDKHKKQDVEIESLDPEEEEYELMEELQTVQDMIEMYEEEGEEERENEDDEDVLEESEEEDSAQSNPKEERKEQDMYSDDDEEARSPPKRRKRVPQASLLESKEALQLKQSTLQERTVAKQEGSLILHEYYTQQSVGHPVAYQQFTLSKSLGRHQDASLLWLVSQAQTEQQILEQCSKRVYTTLLSTLSGDILQMFPENTEAELELGNSRAGKQGIQEDFGFPLYNHWSLYESMLHTRHVAVAQKLWTDQGDLKQKTLFAKIGLPLRDAQGPYQVVSQKLRHLFRTNQDSFGPSFGIVDTNVNVVTKEYDARFHASALDTVWALLALRHSKAIEKHHQLTSNANSTIDAGIIEASNRQEKESFWVVSDAINNTNLQRKGITLQVELLKAVMKQGVAMVLKKEIDTRNVIHYGKIDASPDIAYFTHPNHLAMLGFFITDMIHLKKLSKPLVLGVLLPSNENYLVIGISATRNGVPRQAASIFSKVFSSAAKTIGANIKKDTFEGSTILVKKDDWHMFIEQLVLVFTAQHAMRKF